MKRIFILILTAIIVSVSLLSVGYFFDIKWLMLYYYEETASYWKTSFSLYPIVLAAISCYLVDKFYKQRNFSSKE